MLYIDNILNLNSLFFQLTKINLNRCLSNKSFEEFFVRDRWTFFDFLSINRAVFKNKEFCNYNGIKPNNLTTTVQLVQHFGRIFIKFNCNFSTNEKICF